MYKTLLETLTPSYLFSSEQKRSLAKELLFKFSREKKPMGLIQHTPFSSSLEQPKVKRKIVAEICHESKAIQELYRLRYLIFTQEYGAKIKSLRKIDKDVFDRHCKHVIVRDYQNEKIVGYTRVISYEDSLKIGKFYTENEFSLRAIKPYLSQCAEIGRTCIHPDYRNGATIALLWSKVAEFLLSNNIRYLFGCASLSLENNGNNARAVISKLQNQDAFDPTLHIIPKLPLIYDFNTTAETTKAHIPPLLKAYVKMGARVAPIPHWDKSFNVADLFIFLDLNKTDARYLKHFMREAA